MGIGIQVDQQRIAEFCRKNHIRKLAFFGSVLSESFSTESDVDVLVEFETGHAVGMFRMAALERDLSAILGRKADLRTPAELSPYFRAEVVRESEVQYGAR